LGYDEKNLTMLYIFSGTDTAKVRSLLEKKLAEYQAKGFDVVKVSDAHTAIDLQAALAGGGMFSRPRVVVCEHVLGHEEMGPRIIADIEHLAKTEDPIILLETKIDAATRKKIEEHAHSVVRHDAKAAARDTAIFALADALQRTDKKALWVGYMRELEKGGAPEAIHGVLFWAAKQQALKSTGLELAKANERIAALSELPHDARRAGVELEYALERFVLTL